MEYEKLKGYRDLYRKTLLEDTVPFWMEHGYDRVNGGVYTYLAQDGTRCSTDKAVWAQGRFMWLCSHLINEYGMREEWLAAAKSCKAFLDEHCVDKDGRMFFIVTEDGKPVRKRRYFFSETFYIMGFAEYAKATGDSQALEKARKMFDFVLNMYLDPASDPHQVYPKFEPTRPERALGGPMIMLGVVSVMRRCDPENALRYDECARAYIGDVLKYFYNEKYQCVFEHVAQDGELMLDIPMGRVVNPGHSIEAAWFLLSEAKHFEDGDIKQKALNILEWSLKIGWDEENGGGILYFVDRLGFPPEQYEHDLKLWWPICEALIATLMAYEATKDEKWAIWFEKISAYLFKYMKDDVYGEWFGYLHRDNTVQYPAPKGNYFKGPFHMPRMLCACDGMLSRMLGE